MLAAAPTRDASQTAIRPLAGLSADWLAAAFAPLAARAIDEMVAEGHDAGALRLRWALDLRYVGQSHELTVPCRPGDGAAEIVAAFHVAHAARYGYNRPEAAVELVTLRLSAVAEHVPPALPVEAAGPTAASAALIGMDWIWFADGRHKAALYDRDRLRAGMRFGGPAVVYPYDPTPLGGPGWSAWVDERLNLILETT